MAITRLGERLGERHSWLRGRSGSSLRDLCGLGRLNLLRNSGGRKMPVGGFGAGFLRGVNFIANEAEFI
jgi:hypothetical protein